MKHWNWIVLTYIPGVPGRFLLFLVEGLGLGLGFVWSSWWWGSTALTEEGNENTSPDIILLMFWFGFVS